MIIAACVGGAKAEPNTGEARLSDKSPAMPSRDPFRRSRLQGQTFKNALDSEKDHACTEKLARRAPPENYPAGGECNAESGARECQVGIRIHRNRGLLRPGG
jgi:hypothetical protein